MVPRVHLRNRLLFSFFVICAIVYFLHPYDNYVVLFLRWQTANVRYYIKSAYIPSGHHHHAADPLYKVSTADIGLIIKTGYSTKDRLAARLKAMNDRWKSQNVVIAGDYASFAEMWLNGAIVEVHNVLAGLLKVDLGLDGDAERLKLYTKFKKMTEDPEMKVPDDVLRSGGELDIMKHIPALELGYNHLPKSKWYLMTDDDTYIHLPSLLSILSTLPSDKPHYLGHLNGTHTLRFADTGSGILFSHSAMARMFSQQNKHHLLSAKKESLISPQGSGSKLIAKIAMKAGVYLDEEYSGHFNDRIPRESRVTKERFCTEVLGFHGLDPEEMEATKVSLEGVEDELRWWDLWWAFGEGVSRLRDLEGEGEGKAIREGWDFVGVVDERMTGFETRTERECEKRCENKGDCLSWRWREGRCWAVPWVSVGKRVGNETVSGIEVGELVQLERFCGVG